MTPPWRVEGPSGLEMLTRQSYEENAERLRRLRIFAFGAGKNASSRFLPLQLRCGYLFQRDGQLDLIPALQAAAGCCD